MPHRRLGGGVSADGGVLGDADVVSAAAATASATRGSIVGDVIGVRMPIETRKVLDP